MVWSGTASLVHAQTAGGQSPAPKKNYKDQAEFDAFNEVIKDFNAKSFPKMVTDLDAWTQKYPETEFKTERTFYYFLAYSSAGQPAKVLELAEKTIPTLKTAGFDPTQVAQILGFASYAIRQLPNPTPGQLAIGEKAAQDQIDYVPVFFTAANKPAAVTDAQWDQAKTGVVDQANAALLFVAMVPGSQAMAKKDYPAAEAAFSAAMQKFPDSPQVVYALGGAQIAQLKTDPKKVPVGMFYVARAAVIPPGKWGAEAAATNKAAAAYLERVYTQYHGADPAGLAKLKEVAGASPAPPADFKIMTVSEIAVAKEEEFRKSNPQLAFWMGIKGQLSGPEGDKYFEGSMKDAAIAGQNGGKAFKGTVLEGKPACRSKELIVALSDATTPEVTLKLETPLTNKPLPGEIQFDGAPSAFTQSPFMLTMAVEKGQIEGLKTEACAAPAGRSGPPRKGVSSKKK